MYAKRYKTYTFSEFFNQNDAEIHKIDIIIGHIKKNKKIYLKLVLFVAISMMQLKNVTYAEDFDKSLDKVGTQILDYLYVFAKWSCLGMGLKEMIVALLNGSNFRTASSAGMQYWLGYIFIKLYPKLFEIIAEITF